MSKTALITGGTAGIGLGIAEVFAKNGIHLVLTYFHDAIRAQKVQQALREYGVNVSIKQADSGNKKDLERLFSEIDQLDFLVNNIGASMPDGGSEDWEGMFHHHLMGTVWTTELFSAQTGGGDRCIINISSILGIDPLMYYKGARLAAYCCMKSAVNTYTKLSANTYKGSIRVCAIAPGNTESDSWVGADPEFKKKRAQGILIGRFADPLEIGKMVYQIIDNVGLNGQVFVVDGGVVGRGYEKGASLH